MNKTIYRYIFFILFVSISISEISASTLLPLGIKPFDFFYEKIERQEAKLQDKYHYEIAPYIISDISFRIKPLKLLQNSVDKKLTLFFIGNESFSTQTVSSHASLETLRAGITGKFGNNFFLYSNIILDEQKAEDTLYTGKKWNGLAGGVEQSFLSAKFKYFDFSIGRFKSFWGIKKSLVLSGANALDGFQYSFKYKKLSLTYRFAKLNQLQTDLTTSTFDNRYFAGHRLDLRLHKKLRIGIFETIIFGGVGRTAEFNYINPLLSYHVEQLNNNVNDNSFLGFDFTYYPIKNIKLYGQALIDDFQIEKESQGDQEPNQYGLIVGGYIADVFKTYDIRFEYIKITNRTYNQAFERNQYTFENNVIGYFNENDFDRINLAFIKSVSATKFVSLLYSHTRNGKGSITDLWSEPWLDISGAYSEPFPTGIVEKTHRVSGQFRGFLSQYFYIDTEIGFESIKNRNNSIQKTQQNNFISFTLFTFLSKQL